MKTKNPTLTNEDLKKVMSFLGSIKSEKKAIACRKNGLKPKKNRVKKEKTNESN